MARLSNDGNGLRSRRDNGALQSLPDYCVTLSRSSHPDQPCPPDATDVQFGAHLMTAASKPSLELSPFIKADAMMMDKVLDQLEAVNVTPTQRRDLKSAVQSLCRLIGQDPSGVPANINWVHVRFRRVHPAQAGLSEKRLKNIRAGVIKALELCGASRARSDWLSPPSPAWADILARLPDRHDVWKLTQLAQYCSALNVSPDQVRDEHARALRDAIANETFTDRPDAKVSATVATWNRLCRTRADWPQRPLGFPYRRDRWTFPIEAFPASFQADVARWIDRLAQPDPLTGEGPAKPLRPATLKHQRFNIQQVASAIVRSGTPIEEITELACLVDLTKLKAGLRFYMSRFGGKPTESTHKLATCVKTIARYGVKVDAAHLEEIRSLCTRLANGTTVVRAKNQERLEQLDDDRNLANLLQLPSRLVQLAANKALRPQRRALLLQAALAIEILLHAPMRIGNLSRLSFERHVRRTEVKGQSCLLLSIPGEEVKNNRSLSYELTGETLRLYDLYMRDYRPWLIESPSDYVFPNRSGGPKFAANLSALIKEMIYEHTGLVVHAHLFRSIAGKIHCMIHPGDFVTLGHAIGDTLQTAMKSYAQFEQKNAVRHYQASVAAARDRLKDRAGKHG